MLSHQTAKNAMRPTTYKHQAVQNLPVRSVRIDDAFWSPKLRIVRDVTAYDVLTKFESDGAMQNFDFVADGAEDGYHCGEPWFDGLIYETIRGLSDLLAVHDDEELNRRVDAVIAKIVRAQDAVGDGYLNTYTLLDRPEQRWGENGGNLRWQHDIYNAGCLVEAGVHHYKATGKTALLEAAVKMANHMSDRMGPPPKHNLVPAHSLPEEALLKLYQLAVDEPELSRVLPAPFEASRYLELAEFWIRNRGHHEGRQSHGEYAQDHLPVLQQEEAVGHAVRATLLYTGITALYLATGETAYLERAQKLWDNIAYQKSHVTGGVGAVHEEEKFGGGYELPDDGYLETCAGVGMGFFSWHLYLATGEGRYIDRLETILYNIVLAGRSMNGRKYFYENPLASHGGHHRWEWHSCPCCPPMILKLLPELGSYIYAYDGSGAFVNLYVASETELKIGEVAVRLRQETEYPWKGAVGIAVSPEREAAFALRLRIPEWCGTYAIRVNGKPVSCEVDRGYAVLSRTWSPEDRVVLDLDMPVDLIEAHPNVTTHADRAAIRRGPLLYCLESVDNEKYDKGVARYAREALDPAVRAGRKLPASPEFQTFYDPDFFDGAVTIRTEDDRGRPLVAIPYPYWNNRSRGAMDIWLAYDHPKTGTGWENKLYRKIPLG
ncbi:glycoside hydrolase family 127 protein [Cohnella sp. REN36]|uniref:glycoside hydrolase family 127 protein n=1 Tax=Cohnella sp. REN36 TaxID=2887347 RepID=UPI001D1402C5|nr:beta-L-arabinofuranosidase domain-containing protein [Cohnella sp. REN36]MCC3375036.1 glycoside hydrolase family 127 protein [Cohnella sp. REN36]